MTEGFERYSLSTPRLRLRPLARGDGPVLARIGTDEVFRFEPEIHTPFDAAAWIDGKLTKDIPPLCHVIEERSSAAIAGFCQVRHQSGDLADKFVYLVGFWLAREFWGRGYATEAVREILKLMDARWVRRRTFAKTHPENIASGRVLEKCGFERCAQSPKYLDDGDGLHPYERIT